MVVESEGTDLLELELAPGYSAVLHIQLAGAVKKSFKKVPQLAFDYEISCHVEGPDALPRPDRAVAGHCQTNLNRPAKGAGLRRSGRQLTPPGHGSSFAPS